MEDSFPGKVFGGGEGGGVAVQRGEALWEANIFSGSGQRSENMLLMLMCIRSERANISTALQWQSGLGWILLRVRVMEGIYWVVVFSNCGGFQK